MMHIIRTFRASQLRRCAFAGIMFLAASCASAAAMAAEPVTIDMPMFEGGEGLQFFTYCAREYEKLRPDVTVNLYGDPRIVDKLRVRILEGSYPEATNAFL
ncbi:MAG TPA: hypothetical protein VM186_11560, partial [Planctomycetota bacterium]|nr:hypothetical protein [Planctomycetota bacterium]